LRKSHISAFVKENNLRVYVKDRNKKEVQPRGDPDCLLGVKKGSNQDKAQDERQGEPAEAQTQQQAPCAGYVVYLF